MKSQFTDEALAQIQACGAIAVLVIDDAANAVPTAKALMDGGINAIELTLRTPAALDALANIRREIPEMLAGVGTILTTEQVQKVAEAKAAFGVAPGLNEKVVLAAQAAGLPTLASADVIPKDIAVTDRLHFYSLEQGPAAWANEIIQMRNSMDSRPLSADDPAFADLIEDFTQKGYNSAAEVERLEKLLTE